MFERQESFTQHQASLLVIRLSVNDGLERLDRLGRLFKPEVGRAQKKVRGQVIGFKPQDHLELPNSFTLLSIHMEGQPEIHNGAWVARNGLHKFPVDWDGLLKPAGGHQLLGSGGFGCQVFRPRRNQRDGEGRARSQCSKEPHGVHLTTGDSSLTRSKRCSFHHGSLGMDQGTEPCTPGLGLRPLSGSVSKNRAMQG